MRRRKQSGQAIALVVVFVGLVLMGSLGLAIDSGQLYSHRQMAQVAADAAAEAGIISIFGKTNTSASNTLNGTAFNCTNGSDTHSPCAYARLNGFGLTGSTDLVRVEFPTTVTGVSNLSTTFSPNVVHVVITRDVRTTFLRLFGAAVNTTIKAAGTAAIIRVVNPVPIIITHPTLTNALDIQGSGEIKICGGPTQSIQVNSNATQALNVGGSEKVNLQHAGPLDGGNCTTGTGSDFGTFGGPPASDPHTWLIAGPSTDYNQPSLPIADPFADVVEPTEAGVLAISGYTLNPTPDITSPETNPGTGDCPALATVAKCAIFSPGVYSSGIIVKGGGSGVCTATGGDCVAIFKPGIYYIKGAGAGGVGFGTAANGGMITCTSLTPGCTDSSGCCSAGGPSSPAGMMVYLSPLGGTLNVVANSSLTLKGSDEASAYKGLLFFVTRNATSVQTHAIGGNGAMGLQGSIYLTNSGLNNCILGTEAACNTYQILSLGGGGGTGTALRGQIIVSVLQTNGGGSINMNLSAASILGVNQIALVN